jgi:hypothetical protein
MKKNLVALAVVLLANNSFAQMKKIVDQTVDNPLRVFYCQNKVLNIAASVV